MVVDIPYSALELFEAGSTDRVFYSVGVPGEAAITGYEGLPLPEDIELNTPVFYDAIYKGQPLCLGAMLKPLYRVEFPRPVIVIIIGETTNARQDVVQHLFRREVARKALLIIVTLVVALFATMIAVQPIDNLGQAIRARPEDDLTPVDAVDVPHEVKPLVDAINLHMERIAAMLPANSSRVAFSRFPEKSASCSFSRTGKTPCSVPPKSARPTLIVARPATTKSTI